jgi:hypothetical protein
MKWLRSRWSSKPDDLAVLVPVVLSAVAIVSVTIDAVMRTF